MHAVDNKILDVRHGRYLAENIPGARYIEFPGFEHYPWFVGSSEICDDVEEFVTGVRPAPDSDRVLCTVMFHRHRQLDRARGRGWRRTLARDAGAPQHDRPEGARALPWTGGGQRRRRLLRHIRRTGASRAVRVGNRRRVAQHRPATAGRSPHGRVRDGRTEGCRDRRAHRGADLGACRGRRGSCFEHRQGSRCGSGIHFADRGMHSLKGVPEEWRLFASER